jgi:hypothetical protein
VDKDALGAFEAVRIPGQYGFSGTAVDAVLGVAGETLRDGLAALDPSAVPNYIRHGMGLEDGSNTCATGGSSVALIDELESALIDRRRPDRVLAGMTGGLAGVLGRDAR